MYGITFFWSPCRSLKWCHKLSQFMYPINPPLNFQSTTTISIYFSVLTGEEIMLFARLRNIVTHALIFFIWAPPHSETANFYKAETSLNWTPRYSGNFRNVPKVPTLERLDCITCYVPQPSTLVREVIFEWLLGEVRCTFRTGNL